MNRHKLVCLTSALFFLAACGGGEGDTIIIVADTGAQDGASGGDGDGGGSGGDPVCAPNEFICSGTCVDTQTDDDNCGVCGNECPRQQYCEAGSCLCPGGLELCGDACISLDADPANCGECGTECPDEEVCFLGSCQTECLPPFTDCGGSCIDTNTDLANCGGCGLSCGDEENVIAQCNAGTCITECQPGYYDLDGFPGCEYECAGAPGSVEFCNGVDDDCDGLVDAEDDGYTATACDLTQGICADTNSLCIDGARVCDGRAYSPDDPEVFQPGAESWCDFQDNDCDGDIDEDCCEPGHVEILINSVTVSEYDTYVPQYPRPAESSDGAVLFEVVNDTRSRIDGEEVEQFHFTNVYFTDVSGGSRPFQLEWQSRFDRWVDYEVIGNGDDTWDLWFTENETGRIGVVTVGLDGPLDEPQYVLTSDAGDDVRHRTISAVRTDDDRTFLAVEYSNLTIGTNRLRVLEVDGIDVLAERFVETTPILPLGMISRGESLELVAVRQGPGVTDVVFITLPDSLDDLTLEPRFNVNIGHGFTENWSDGQRTLVFFSTSNGRYQVVRQLGGLWTVTEGPDFISPNQRVAALPQSPTSYGYAYPSGTDIVANQLFQVFIEGVMEAPDGTDVQGIPQLQLTGWYKMDGVYWIGFQQTRAASPYTIPLFVPASPQGRLLCNIDVQESFFEPTPLPEPEPEPLDDVGADVGLDVME